MSIDSRWFLDINDFARSTPWLHVFFADYAKYGVALFSWSVRPNHERVATFSAPSRRSFLD
jgi:hypothetical protein